MKVIVGNREIVLSDNDIIGEGGEAIVYKKANQALKIYHSNVLSDKRVKKLHNFPKRLPKSVLAPTNLIFDTRGACIGFSMDLIDSATEFNKLSSRKFREAKVDNNSLVKIFKSFHNSLDAIHNSSVVVGDLNDLNLLFKNDEVFFIDADSMQFSGFPSTVATQDFLDPKLYGIDLADGNIYFNKQTDYYSFMTMFVKSLLFVHPYGGVHKTYKNFLRRAEASVSIYNSDVKYPKNAIHYKILPDELNHQFYKVFEEAKRFKLEAQYLDLDFKVCPSCGISHARHACPICSNVTSNPQKQTTIIKNNILRTTVFKTSGYIMDLMIMGDKLFYLYDEAGLIKRESSTIATSNGKYDVSLYGKDTFVKQGNFVSHLKDNKVVDEFNADFIAANSFAYFYAKDLYMYNSKHKPIAQVYSENIWFKLGDNYGFGMYRVGRKYIYFLIDIVSNTLDDSITLPDVKGTILEKEVYFSRNYVFFILKTRYKGVDYIYSFMLKDSNLIAYKKEKVEESIWTNVEGKVLNGSNVLTISAEGLKLISSENGIFEEKNIFENTKDFISEDSRLYSSKDGIYVVDAKEINLLKMK